ncbi:MAG: hypothetical protein ACK5C0_14770 [Candidatus Kapaibacterium sp.]|jgi:hypothetical protein|nr:hypothetical protein [Ignavibacteria bacterium]MBN8574285.1 hypothetical protein [Candidatus Kapabacteria bacterium]HRE56429.1 hypothetical protein [Candidatus Kapabacteria bacterium]
MKREFQTLTAAEMTAIVGGTTATIVETSSPDAPGIYDLYMDWGWRSDPVDPSKK